MSETEDMIGRQAIKYLTVNNRLLDNQSNLQIRKIEKIHPINFCCCYEQGKVKLTTYFEKSSYYIDEDMFIICELENESQCKVSKLQAIFSQKVHVEAEGANDDLNFTVKSDKAEVNLIAGRKMTGNNAIRLHIPV